MNRFMNMDAKCPKTITPDDYVITPPVAATFMHWIVHPANQPEANYLNADQLKAVRELRRQRVRLREMGQRQTQTINRKLGSLCGASEYFMQYYTILHHVSWEKCGATRIWSTNFNNFSLEPLLPETPKNTGY